MGSSTRGHPENKTLLTLRDAGIEPHGTALVYPWEYARLLSSHLSGRANVDAVVFLGFADNRGDREFRRLPAQVVGSLLDKSILAVPNKHLNVFGHESAAGRRERIRSAVLDLPAFSFRYFFPSARSDAEQFRKSLVAAM